MADVVVIIKATKTPNAPSTFHVYWNWRGDVVHRVWYTRPGLFNGAVYKWEVFSRHLNLVGTHWTFANFASETDALDWLQGNAQRYG